jgi:hypothetical protein
MPTLSSSYQRHNCYTEITAAASEKLTGGAPQGRVIGSGSSRLPVINASPVIIVAPLLTSSTNSFNFIGNDNKFISGLIQFGSNTVS